MREGPAWQRGALLPLLATAALAAVLFVWQLGATGLVDETPPLFAASARAMAESGDWLVPQVNGLPRYDKPPLVYWLMGLLYALPGHGRWDPLGSWAAGLPSALACGAVMLLLADTLLRWPQTPESAPSLPASPAARSAARSAVAAALAFALSPLVLLWGRIGVSDALFTATLAASLLLAWRAYATARPRWWQPWLVLALAVLTKGPVAVLLMGGTLALFAASRGEGRRLVRQLRPLRGLVVCAALAVPWYGLVLLREGQPFWDSFFGYHNLQRFTAVVNHHLQPWWFFGPVLVAASLPATPLLLLGLVRALGAPAGTPWAPEGAAPLPPNSLARFAACWLLVVLAFFTVAATKLPSYWLPATPAAALLVVVGAAESGDAEPKGVGPGGMEPGGMEPGEEDRALGWAWRLTLLLNLVLGAVFLLGPWWVPWIQDPELPTLPAGILASGRLPLAGGCCLLAAAWGWGAKPGGAGLARLWPLPLLRLQLPLVAFVPLALLPLWGLGDRLRGAPVRTMAAAVRTQARPGEPLAMVGILKPSLHFYSRKLVLYEGLGPQGPANLADRLGRERRRGQRPTRTEEQPTLLVVIDGATAARPPWNELGATELHRSGPYRLWRLERRRLEQRAQGLGRAGVAPDWWRPRPERY